MPDKRLMKSGAVAAPSGHYNHAVSAGNMVFVSGQLPITPQGHKLTDESFETQAHQVFDNLDMVLASFGCSRNDLVQVRVYLCDIAFWPHFNELYAAWIGEHLPARCVVPVPTLNHNLALEIEAIAQRPVL